MFACCFPGRCAPLSRRLVAQGVFVTTEPAYKSQPWGASQPMMLALHSDDENGAHMGSTPSVPTMADFQQHTVKIRYTRGFTTEKQGSGTVTTTDIVDADNDRRRLQGDSLTRFKSELRTGFEFGYASRVKANVKVKLQRDATDPLAQGPAVNRTAFGDDGVAVRVININDDDSADLEDTNLTSATAAEADARAVLAPAFMPAQASGVQYNIIKEFPGEIQVFIDDMDRYVFQVAVEDRDMAKILDGDGNAFIGFTASTGSRGFALPGYDPEEVHQTHDIVSWNFCNNPGCVPCACATCLLCACGRLTRASPRRLSLLLRSRALRFAGALRRVIFHCRQNSEPVLPPRASTPAAAAAPGDAGPGGASIDGLRPSIAARME